MRGLKGNVESLRALQVPLRRRSIGSIQTPVRNQSPRSGHSGPARHTDEAAGGQGKTAARRVPERRVLPLRNKKSGYQFKWYSKRWGQRYDENRWLGALSKAEIEGHEQLEGQAQGSAIMLYTIEKPLSRPLP